MGLGLGLGLAVRPSLYPERESVRVRVRVKVRVSRATLVVSARTERLEDSLGGGRASARARV